MMFHYWYFGTLKVMCCHLPNIRVEAKVEVSVKDYVIPGILGRRLFFCVSKHIAYK